MIVVFDVSYREKLYGKKEDLGSEEKVKKKT